MEGGGGIADGDINGGGRDEGGSESGGGIEPLGQSGGPPPCRGTFPPAANCAFTASIRRFDANCIRCKSNE